MTEPAAGRPFDIFVVGLGIEPVRHLTRDAEDCLRASQRVFMVDPGFGVVEHVRQLCPRVTSLLGHYHEGHNRVETYRSMAAEVVHAALEDPPVAFATYGHPLFFVYPSVLIRAAADLLDLSVHVVPGISSVDTLLVDLAFDPGLTGLQLYEATAVLVHDRRLDPEVPCLLFQVDTVESAFFTVAASRPERFHRLQAHLRRFYPADHEIVVVRSAGHPVLGPTETRFPLSELAERLAAGASGTMFIPPVRIPEVRDRGLGDLVHDRRHLADITYSDEADRSNR